VRFGFLALAAATVVMSFACLGGCGFDFGFGGTRYRCGAGGRCPEGQTCVGGFCEVGVDVDAALDDGGDDDGNSTDGAMIDGAMTDGGGIDAMPVATCGTISLLRDDFATAGDGPFFDLFNGTGIAVNESVGRLVIDLSMTASDVYGGYESTYLYDLHEGELVAQVVETSADATILEVRGHMGTSAQLVVQGTQIYAGIFPSPGTIMQRAWQSNERYLRISENNGDMVWWTSTNGTAWTEFHRRALPFDVSHVQGSVGAGGMVAALSRSSWEEVNPSPPPTVYCPSEQLSDNFATAGLYPLWYVYQNSGCTITETGGNLVVNVTAGSTSSFCGMNGSHLYDFSRGNGIAVDANTFPAIANFDDYITASVPGVANDGNRIEMVLENTDLVMRIMVNDAQVFGSTITFNRATHRWWRMRGTGSTVIWETATTGQDWTERYRATAPFPLAPLDVNIGFGRYATIAAAQTITLPGVNAP
jgi:hypothetical protein